MIMSLFFIVFFFFSSRRRHTRSLCDWSSDVCSSDLDSRHARREVVAQGEQSPVEIEEANQPVGHIGCLPPGAHEHLGVLERRRDDLLVARRLEPLQHARLQLAPPAHGFACEIERPGWNRRDRRARLHRTTRTAPTRRLSISTISKTAPFTATWSPTLGRRPSTPNR